MPIRGQSGNRVVTDEFGFTHGGVKSVDVVTNKDKKNGGDWQSIRWVFTGQGTIRVLECSELTGFTIHPPNDKGMNKLTTIVTRLGILTLEDIEKDELPDHDFESAVGLAVKFKVRWENGFYKVDLPTLSLDEDTEVVTKPRKH